MSFTIIGDLHIKHDNLDKIENLFDIIESMGNTNIILGDSLDTKEIIRGKCLNLLYKRLSQSKLYWIILIGNHCWFSNDCKEHSLESLKSLKNVRIVDKPLQIESMLYMPYYRDNNLLRQDLAKFKNVRILVGHLDIKSFDFGNGFISEEGLHPDELKDYPLVISGHYHKYQMKNNIVYLGTPFSHNFGESNQIKYLGILDHTEFRTIQTNFPKHITIELDASNPSKVDLNPVNYNRVIVKGSKEELDAFNFEPYKQFKIVQECLSKVVKSELKETETPQSLYKTWFTEIKKSEDIELFNTGLQILEDVK